MTGPRLLTIILNFRTADMTLQSAQAALREMQGIDGGIVIVDNDSGDGSFEAIQSELMRPEWPADRIEVVASGHNGGFGAGNNFGVRHGMAQQDYDYVYILNSDAFPDPGSIRALMQHLQANPKTGLAGSYIHGPDGDPHLTAFRFPSLWGELEGAARVGVVSKMLEKHIVPLPIPAETTPVDWLAGASMMIRREVLEQIGLFDETFFLYFEETDLCLRAARAGWATDYVRTSEVTHIGSVSTGMKTWTRMPRYWFDSRLYFFRQNHGGLYAGTATLAHLAGGLIWRLRRLIGGKPRRDPDWFLWDLVKHYCKFSLKPTKRERTSIPDFPISAEPASGGEIP
ncbi:glycosyltransferase family 2 protein [Shimia sp.]|uniref:glycosyltransferase family 2 protein n=1 Tax=Shimia sp. TaxID=1954381 RepID=UPI003298AD62